MINPSAQFENAVCDESGEIVYVEAEAMYDLGARLRDILGLDGRTDPFVSRTGRGVRTTLRDETALTRFFGCDILVALHSDATGKPGVPGGGSWAFYCDETNGRPLADAVQGEILTAIRGFHPDVIDKGVQTHWNRLWALHESGCPAALFEILFHSNPAEREMLKDANVQDAVARAIARGIWKYFGLEERDAEADEIRGDIQGTRADCEQPADAGGG